MEAESGIQYTAYHLVLGEIIAYGSDSGNSPSDIGAFIRMTQNAASGASYVPVNITFGTGTNAAVAATRMTITSGGLVGIGLTPTTELLEVAGNVKITADSGANRRFVVDRTAATDFGRLMFSTGNDLASVNGAWAIGLRGTGGVSPTGMFSIYNESMAAPSAFALSIAIDTICFSDCC